MVAALLWLVTILLYLPVTHHEFLDYDDDRYVTANLGAQQGLTVEALKRELLNPMLGNWQPVTMFSHMVDCQLYGLKAGGHHFTSVLIHALNAVLVLVLFRRLTGAFWRSACVAALFAWHPLHVESVAWVAERKDVLSTCFGLLALLAYVRYARWRESQRDSVSAAGYRSTAYWRACLWLALGLLSKPMLVTWPGVFLLLDYWPLNRFQPGRWQALVAEKIPFFVLAAATGGLTFLVQKQMGAMRALAHVPLPMRCENALISVCRYLLKMVWPTELAVFYAYPGSWPPASVLLAALFLIAATVLILAGRKRRPFMPVGWFWFLGTLMPVIGLVQVGEQAMADRYTYIPSLGVFVLLVWGASELFRNSRHRAVILSAAAATVLLLCCAATARQIGYWQDSKTLFQRDLEITADNELARNNLGDALAKEGNTDGAITQFRAALHLKPDCVEAHYNLASMLLAKSQTNEAIHHLNEAIRLQPDYSLAHNNLAILLAIQGQTNAALGEYEEAIRFQPDYADAHFNLGNLLARCGRLDDAVDQLLDAEHWKPRDAEIHAQVANLLAKKGKAALAVSEYQQAIRLNPNAAEACYKLGNLYARGGLKDAAISEFQAAVRARPDFAEAHNNLGNLLSAQGRVPEAISQFQEAVRVQPDYPDAHFNLGNALFKNEQFDGAISQYQTAIQLAPDFAPAHFYLGVALAKKGQADQAIVQFQETLRLRPNDAMAHNRLGVVLDEKGRADDAIAQFREALRLKPDYAEASNNLARALEAKSASGKH